MRAVIQRVKQAKVIIDSKIHAQIRQGLLILLGIEATDNDIDIAWLSKKICQLRIFNDKEDVMNLSVTDTSAEIMVVSQFTLYASTKKGNRPSYIRAAQPEIAVPLYKKFLNQIENDLGKSIASGVFGAMMDIELVNDGPVTILIDTKQKE